MERLFSRLLAGVLVVAPVWGQPQTVLEPETWLAFQEYTTEVEHSWGARMTGAAPFLVSSADPELRRKLLDGEVVTRRVMGYETEVPKGYVHHWLSMAHVPGVDLEAAFAFLRDSERHVAVYPEVVSAEIVERRENFQKVKKRMVKRKFVTVAADTVGDNFYDKVGPNRMLMRGYTLEVREIVNMGKPDETLRPAGKGTGLFWGLNGYWWLEEADGGVMLELESVALTRGIPAGLRWLVGPFLKTVPKQSMGVAMRLTREAMLSYREERLESK